MPAAMLYGFAVKTFVGALYGPSLWFGVASLKLKETRPSEVLPKTVSPVWNTPLVMLTSINFGEQNLVTSTSSK